MTEVYGGIDIGKRRIDAWLSPEGSYRTFENTPEGRRSLSEWLKRVKPQIVVVEASGAYEIPVTESLIESGIRVARVNPRQARDFAKATGVLAKTDKVDCGILAAYAEKLRPAETKLPCQEVITLNALITRRRQLVDMAIEEKNRLESTIEASMRAEVIEHLAWIKKKIGEIDKRIKSYAENTPELARAYKALKEVKGIGETTAAVLLAELPELGRAAPERLASLVGVAPFNHDSGTLRGQRHIRGGRRSVRCTLYMATLTAIRHHERLSPFYKRLRQAGKPGKVAIVAAMRKYLTYLNAILRDLYSQSPS